MNAFARTVQEALAPHVKRRNAAYRAVFSGPLGEAVLKDLLRTIDADPRAIVLDPQALAYDAGRRAVVRHIAEILNLTDERTLAATLAARPFAPEEGADE